MHCSMLHNCTIRITAFSWSNTKETRQLLTGLKEVKDLVSAVGFLGEGGHAIFNQIL